MKLKESLLKLVEACDKLGEERVTEIINEVYANGAQAEDVITYSAEEV